MKKILLMLAAIGVAVSLQAEMLTPSQALARANKCLPTSLQQARRAPSVPSRLVYTLKSQGEAAAYAFAQGSQGWMLLSADDAVAPVLGWSTSSSWDIADMPPGLKELLEQYGEEIAYLRRVGAKAPLNGMPAGYGRPERIDVAPLCTTKWNQSAPYNNRCPQVDSVTAPTGCVATAMTQIMKHYNHPAQPHGNVSYTMTDGTSLNLNLDTVSLDWPNMLDVYTKGKYNDEQADAVATLMQAYGYAVKMSYGKSASAATTSKAVTVLPQYFGYDKSIRYIERKFYRLIEWEDAIYGNLRQGMPVNLRGTGHSFVCDGLSDRALFHINWGWGGKSDGYFLLTSLSPDAQGIGGGNAGYSDGAAAVINIQPDKGGQPFTGLAGKYFMTAEYNASTDVLTVSGFFGNIGSAAFSGTLDLDAYRDSTLVKTINTRTISNLSPNTGYTSYTVNALSTKGLANGNYRLYFYYRPNGGERVKLPTLNTQADYIDLRIGSTGLTVAVPALGNLWVDEPGVNTTFYNGTSFSLHPVVSSESPYAEDLEIYPVLCKTDANRTVVHRFPRIQGNIYPGKMAYGYDAVMPDSAVVAPGRYFLQFQYNAGSKYKGSAQILPLSGYTTITVKGTPEAYSPLEGSFKILNTTAVDPDNIQVDYTLKNTGGYFADYLRFRLYETTDANALATLNTPYVYLNAGDSVSGTFTFRTTAITKDNRYRGRLWYLKEKGGKTLKSLGTFQYFNTVSTRSGVEGLAVEPLLSVTPNPAVGPVTVTAPQEIKSVELYTLAVMPCVAACAINGRRASLDVAGEPTGIYLLRVTFLDGTTATARLIKQ